MDSNSHLVNENLLAEMEKEILAQLIKILKSDVQLSKAVEKRALAFDNQGKKITLKNITHCTMLHYKKIE